MDDPKVHGRRVFILAIACLGVIQACSPAEVRKCQGYSLISMMDFHAFIPGDRLDEVCSHLQAAVSCVQTVLQGCPITVTFAFDAQGGVIDAVCDKKKKEYLESVSCFTQKNLRDSITKKCLSSMIKFSDKKDKCSFVRGISECAKTTTLMFDGCATSDANLMKELVDIYLQPTFKVFDCTVPEDDATDTPETAQSEWTSKITTTSHTVSEIESTSANETTNKESFPTVTTNENADDKELEVDEPTQTAMSRQRGPVHQATNSTSETTASEDETPLYAAARKSSSGSKSKGSSKNSKSSTKSSSSSGTIKRTTSGTAYRKTSSGSNSKSATTVKPTSKEMTTSKSKTTDKYGKGKSGSETSDKKERDKSSSNSKGGQASFIGSDDKNKSVGLRVSSVIWISMTSLVYVLRTI